MEFGGRGRVPGASRGGTGTSIREHLLGARACVGDRIHFILNPHCGPIMVLTLRDVVRMK